MEVNLKFLSKERSPCGETEALRDSIPFLLKLKISVKVL